jgi:hypothetical protein
VFEQNQHGGHYSDSERCDIVEGKLPASCFTEQTSGEPREILDVVRRGALATETYVFECDEAVGEIALVDVQTGCNERGPVSFVSTDGELRA